MEEAVAPLKKKSVEGGKKLQDIIKLDTFLLVAASTIELKTDII